MINRDLQTSGIYRAMLIDYNDVIKVYIPEIHTYLDIDINDISSLELHKNILPTPIWNLPNLEAQQHEIPTHPCWITFENGDMKRPVIMGWLGKGIQYSVGDNSNVNVTNNDFDSTTDDMSISTSGYAWPTPSCTTITSPYGYRIHPVTHKSRFHSGIDIGATHGSDIIASKDGQVSFSGVNGGYGNCIIINHSDNIQTLYAHCSQLLASTGAEVKQGDIIAKVGATGLVTGPHLHFEIRVNGSTVDPTQYVKA